MGRIGGDEFALLLPETDIEQATMVAERLRNSVAPSVHPMHDASGNFSVSIGVAAATLSMSGLDALLKGADQALYEAKSLGRNRVVSFEPRYPFETKLAAESFATALHDELPNRMR